VLCVTIWQRDTLVVHTTINEQNTSLRHESGPALPGINYSSDERAILGVIKGKTYHTNIVTVEQRLSKLCRLPALRRHLAARVDIQWTFLHV